MAHLQVRGKRVSGKKLSLMLSKTVDLELWGPINTSVTPSEEFGLVAADPSKVEVVLGDMNTKANARLYKVTAKGFGSCVVRVVAGTLQIDFVEVHVLPNAADVPFAGWFEEVVPGVMRALRANAAGGGPRIENKLGFFVAQAFSEQSPGAVGDPSSNGNRLFNIQALVTRNAANKITGVVPGQTEAGVSIKDLKQGEGATDATRVMLSSPTFVYDSPQRAVSHYLKILKERYGSAYAAITTPAASFAQFAQALQNAKFATHAAYAADLQSNSSNAIKWAKKWVSFQIHTLADELAKSTNATRSSELQAELQLMNAAQEELKNFK